MDLRNLVRGAVALIGAAGCAPGAADAPCATSDTCAADASSFVDGTMPASSPDASLAQDDGGGAPVESGQPDVGSFGLDGGADSSCTTGQKMCGAGCVSVTDPSTGCSASSCDACKLPNGTATCGASGACAIAACVAPFADCNHDPSDGCEIDTSTATDCGGCGNACVSAAPYCIPGKAGYACGTSCASGQSLCGTTCANLATDPNHCGTCTTKCSGAGTGAVNECISSKCQIGCSDAGATLCPTGACDDLSSDDSNCGSCGHACPAIANGTDHCIASTCTPACNPPYSLCGGACYAVDTTKGVFVSAAATATSACGAVNAPCGTIAAGIAAANLLGRSLLYLDKGTYAEQVTLAPNLTLQGGWLYAGGGAWNRACTGDPSALAVIAPKTGSPTVTANGVTATLDTLTVKSAPTAGPGASLLGIFAVAGANLTVKNVEVSVSAGGQGVSGGQGAAGTGTIACSGSAVGSGSTGAAGGVGKLGAGGTYSVSGCQPATAGSGGTGAAGANGVAGAAGSTVSCSQCESAQTCCQPSDGCNPPSCTTACQKDPDLTITGTAGQSGCGGNPGMGGGGGAGGGSSIGIFSWGATVNVSGGSIVAGAGGTGGGGAAGGSGASGSVGASGTGDCQDSNCPSSGTKCVDSIRRYAGGAGSTAGTGGAGGQGGGGAGGDSFAYYQGGGGSVSAASTTLSAGAAGKGGAPNGAAGLTGAHN